ncbi:MAG: rhomboid family intramembrane serine protease [Pyrinomonadaceae bacterium]|nr:rhomboid family intramembrane serine protease [Pyrinomonadaceae bacterium]
MFPIGDDDSARRTVPVVTYALILLNVLVFLLELTAGDQFIMEWSVVPRRLLSNPASDFPTLFTAMFMHAGWLHLLGNMLYLWIFGDNIEDALGHVKYLVFYLICGLAADAAQILVGPNSNIPNLGASGAIAGVLGAYLVMFPRGQVRVLMGQGVIPMPALVVIGLWIVLQLVSGIGSITTTAETGGVAYMAHIGGFIAGLVMAFVLKNTRSTQVTT